MSNTHHLTAGARGDMPLVRDDVDRYALLACISAALGAAVLAYCLMGTHLHLSPKAAGSGSSAC